MELRKLSSKAKLWFFVESAKPNLNSLLLALLFLCVFLLAQQHGMIWTSHPFPSALKAIPGLNATSYNADIHAAAAKLEEVPKQRGIHEVTRHMFGFGVAEYTFVLTGAYRIGAGSFAVVGLASKPLHQFGNPQFECQWYGDNQTQPLVGSTAKYLPDWGYGRAYTVVVVHCNFANEKDTHYGGKLRFFAGNGRIDRATESIVALEEKPGDYKESNFPGGKGFKHKYEYLYCGSSIYGDVDPDRLGEWIAYHAWFLGPRCHFVLHDVGALKSEANQRVLEPWVKAGLVTVQDFVEESNYDGYYHNQFLVVNDCLFRYKHAAKWTFFFDIDEFLHVPPPGTLKSVLDQLGMNNSQIMFEQNLMSHNVCLAKSRKDHPRQWAMEKLVFKNVKKGENRNRKYVIRAGLADSAGVHLSEHVRGKSLYSKGMLNYYHYHETISKHGDTCKAFVAKPRYTKKAINVTNIPYVYDATMVSLAAKAKEFQQHIIGNISSSSSAFRW